MYSLNEYEEQRAMVAEPRELWEPEEGGFSETPDHPSGLRGGKEPAEGLSGEPDTSLTQPTHSSWHPSPSVTSSPSLTQTCSKTFYLIQQF